MPHFAKCVKWDLFQNMMLSPQRTSYFFLLRFLLFTYVYDICDKTIFWVPTRFKKKSVHKIVQNNKKKYEMKWRRKKKANMKSKSHKRKPQKDGKKLVISPLTFSTSIRLQHMVKLWIWTSYYTRQQAPLFYGFSNYYHRHYIVSCFFFLLLFIMLGERIFFVIVIWSRVPFNSKITTTKPNRKRLHTGLTRNTNIKYVCVSPCRLLSFFFVRTTLLEL